MLFFSYVHNLVTNMIVFSGYTLGLLAYELLSETR
jgi:hypothetical protein